MKLRIVGIASVVFALAGLSFAGAQQRGDSQMKGEPPCVCVVELFHVITLDEDTRLYMYIFGAMAENCANINDFHLKITSAGTIVGCSVDPNSAWFCILEHPDAWWWTVTNPIPSGVWLPEMGIVVDGVQGDVDFDVAFTFDGNERCTTMASFPNEMPTPTERETWGRIKSMYR
jgi:hypothetical protein